MKVWSVIPLKSVGKITFGMKREEVRKIFDNNFEEFKKSKFSKNSTDDFSCCHVFYNVNNECEAVEIFTENDLSISIDEKVVFPALVSQLSDLIPSLKKDSDGDYIDNEYSIGIYAPFEKCESILFGCENYYN